MEILNAVVQSNLELAVVAVIAVVAMRLITAISFSAGRKAGIAAVFAAEAAFEEARSAARAADAAAASARTWLQDRKQEAAKIEQNWQRFTYEHRSYVSEHLVYAEAGFERALKAQIDANQALESARENVASLQAKSLR